MDRGDRSCDSFLFVSRQEAVYAACCLCGREKGGWGWFANNLNIIDRELAFIKRNRLRRDKELPNFVQRVNEKAYPILPKVPQRLFTLPLNSRRFNAKHITIWDGIKDGWSAEKYQVACFPCLRPTVLWHGIRARVATLCFLCYFARDEIGKLLAEQYVATRVVCIFIWHH